MATKVGKKLQLVLAQGENKTSTKTIANINQAATDANLLGFGNDYSGLQQHQLQHVLLVETRDLVA